VSMLERALVALAFGILFFGVLIALLGTVL
jgi:hypothetical protein